MTEVLPNNMITNVLLVAFLMLVNADIVVVVVVCLLIFSKLQHYYIVFQKCMKPITFLHFRT